MRNELTGHRNQDMAYRNFHREAFPDMAATFDLDAVIFCENSAGCRRPLTLLEIAVDYGQEKPSSMLAALAAPRIEPLPAWVVLFTVKDGTIDHFRVRHADHPGTWLEMSRADYVAFLRESRASMPTCPRCHCI